MSEEAGWYPDPDNSMQSRYWDGSRWTDSTKPIENGADYWFKNVESKNSQPSVTPSIRPPRTASRSSASERSKVPTWLVVIGIYLAIVVLVRGCEAQQDLWRMGVDGNGYRVVCEDGTVSMSGGKQGACSQHGGVR